MSSCSPVNFVENLCLDTPRLAVAAVVVVGLMDFVGGGGFSLARKITVGGSRVVVVFAVVVVKRGVIPLLFLP